MNISAAGQTYSSNAQAVSGALLGQTAAVCGVLCGHLPGSDADQVVPVVVVALPPAAGAYPTGTQAEIMSQMPLSGQVLPAGRREL